MLAGVFLSVVFSHQRLERTIETIVETTRRVVA